MYLEGGEGVRSDVESGHLHEGKEGEELLRVEDQAGQGFVADALPEHRTTVEANLRVLVPVGRRLIQQWLHWVTQPSSPVTDPSSPVTHPLMRMNSISLLVHTYSTVGDRVPICRRRMLLKIWATSFLA